MLDVLANRTYRHLFAAQVIALAGTGLLTLALGLRAYELAGADAGVGTSEVLAGYAAAWRSSERGAPEWLFLTAPDRSALTPVLAANGQAVSAKPDPDAAGGPLFHIFRAFLIDASGQIRNIYSLDFLDPDLVLTGIKT
jgi:hypothetical protein